MRGPVAAMLLALTLAPLSGFANGKIQGKVTLERVTDDAKKVATSAGAVIYVIGFSTPPPKETAKILQREKAFEPQVMPIVKGQKVAFVNSDKVRHNVFSVSRAKAFDLGLTPPGDGPKVDFDSTGKVDVYCNIHPEMNTTVLVLPNNAFAITREDGSYEIPSVPPGEYTVYAWHQLGTPVKEKIKVVSGQMVRKDWKLTLDKSLEPHLDKHGRPYKKRDKYDE